MRGSIYCTRRYISFVCVFCLKVPLGKEKPEIETYRVVICVIPQNNSLGKRVIPLLERSLEELIDISNIKSLNRNKYRTHNHVRIMV